MFRLQSALGLMGGFLLLQTAILSSTRTAPIQTPIQIEFLASKPSWIDKEYTGHAFMCISIPVGSGVKEDCFGFYPINDSPRGFIGGPGVTEPEFIKNPSRFSRVTQSIKKPITEEQRRQVLRQINEWNNKHFNLTNQSCIDFVNSIAQMVGWSTPPRASTDLPETFLKKLVEVNK